ncbi:MAG: hypothetical protein Q8867_09570 [Bacteroidota bacterium]|nr:hypothetical protein [Bacteroidota bacterium]
MTFNEIDTLLEKFYEGLTSGEEEKQLREFFLSGKYPDYMEADAEYFLGVFTMSENTCQDDDFEKKFFERISEKRIVKIHPVRPRFVFAFGIAASILILIGLFLTFRYEKIRKQELQTNATLEMTYHKAENALLLVSYGLNTGLEPLSRLTVLNKGIDDMQRIFIFNKYQSLISNPDGISSPSTNNP